MVNCVSRWSVAGPEAVGLADNHHRSLSAVGCDVTPACWSQDALSTMICALMSPVSSQVSSSVM